jgi:CheY-like chemotaxis protein
MERGTAVICDDDPLVRSVGSRLLGDDGWRVVGLVDRALDAIELARRLHPDVVVLDVSLVGLSGLEAIAELVSTGAAVVVCTAFGSFAESARRAGAAAVVDKAELGMLADVVAAAFPKAS